MKSNIQLGESIILNDITASIDYIDLYTVNIDNRRNHSIDYLTALFFTSIPGWARMLLKLLDVMARPFGLEGAPLPEPGALDASLRYRIGDRAVFFRVIGRSDSEIVMGENDRHLSFRTSMLLGKEPGRDYQTVYCTTCVHYHNLLGKLYFIPVKPFHRLIVKSMLKNLSRRVAQAGD